MDVGFFALVVLFAVIVIAAAAYQFWRNQKRIQQLQQFCLGKGWQFVPADDEYAVRWNCPPFFQGRNRRARDVISGAIGTGALTRSFVAFDYSYVTDSNNGKSSSSTTHRFAICAVRLPAYLPRLTITPETTLSRLGNAVVREDIDLESEAFNRRFHVQCPDPKFASDALPPRTMQALLARSPLHFRIEGCDALCWEPGVTTPIALLERLSTLSAFVDGIPEFVWHDYGPDEGADARVDERGPSSPGGGAT
jgi:hypothetical protein